MLQDAAVLGKTFTKRALAALSGLADEALEPLLASLVRKEVLAVQADPRSPEHGQYGFLQDLVRHVAYETLSKRERQARHLAAASHLEASFADEEEIVEVLASHYLDAYREVPGRGGRRRDQGEGARDAQRGPGERAASLAAAREAQRYFQQAAELTDEPLVRAELDEKAGPDGVAARTRPKRPSRCSRRRSPSSSRRASSGRRRGSPACWPRSTSARARPTEAVERLERRSRTSARRSRTPSSPRRPRSSDAS